MLGWVDVFILQNVGLHALLIFIHCWSSDDFLMFFFFLWILMYSPPGILLGCTPVCRALWTCASLWKKPSSAKPSKRQREQTKVRMLLNGQIHQNRSNGTTFKWKLFSAPIRAYIFCFYLPVFEGSGENLNWNQTCVVMVFASGATLVRLSLLLQVPLVGPS